MIRNLTRRRGRHRRWSQTESQRGAALIEFALVLPIILVLLLGIITGGIGMNRNISMQNAAREAARYGATLPVDGDLTTWLNTVATVAIDAATGDLDDGEPGRRICIAYVFPDGTDLDDRTVRILVDAAGTRTVSAGNVCHADGRPADERRVQVEVQRLTDLEVVFWSRTLTLEGSSTARYERSGY